MSKTGFIYMNLVANNQNTVGKGEAIKFDDIKKSDDGIMYDSTSNTILFAEGGIFYVSWWVSVMDTSKRGQLSTILKNEKNESLASGDINLAPTTDVDEASISSNGIIKVSKGERIRLVNSSVDSIMLNRENGYSGAMVIYEIESTSYAFVRNSGNTGEVKQGEVINMDTLDFSSEIMYKDGSFTIVESGRYYIAWKGNLDISKVVQGNLEFALAILRNGVQLLSSVTRGGIGFIIQLSQGFGVVDLEMGDVIGLYNISDTSLEFSNLNEVAGIPVNLGIYKL